MRRRLRGGLPVAGGLPNGAPPSDGMWVPNVPWGLHRSLHVHGGCGYTGWLLLRQEHPTRGWMRAYRALLRAGGWAAQARLGC